MPYPPYNCNVVLFHYIYIYTHACVQHDMGIDILWCANVEDKGIVSLYHYFIAILIYLCVGRLHYSVTGFLAMPVSSP